MDLHQLTIQQAKKGLEKKEFSSVDLVNAMLDRIEKLDGDIGAYISVDADGAKESAVEADRRIANKEHFLFPLLGIPIALKDLLCTKGLKTTCASKILENFVPQYDATVVSMLKNAGAVIIDTTVASY